jgi:hypothetical protein
VITERGRGELETHTHTHLVDHRQELASWLQQDHLVVILEIQEK